MGCGPSFDAAFHSEKFLEWNVQFSALQLSKSELRRLYKIFCRVDVDGSGSIALSELLAHIDVERTRFTERVFSIFDEDGSGEIDFREFVLSLWNYCTLTKATLDMFAFDLYDYDHSGELSAKEIQRMLKDIYGADSKTNFHAKNIANELASLERAGSLIDVETFRLFAKNHQALLFPAFQMQHHLQKHILGQRFWRNNAQRRIRVSKGTYIPVAQFLAMHINSDLLHHTVGETSRKKQEMDARATVLFKATGTTAKRRKSALIDNAEVQKQRQAARDIATSGGGITDGADVSTSMLMVDSITNAFNSNVETGDRQYESFRDSGSKKSTAAAGAALIFANSIKSRSGGSSKPPKPIPASGKFSNYSTTEDVVRELGSGAVSTGDSGKTGSSKQRRRSSFGEDGSKLYSTDALSGKQRKNASAAGPTVAPLTMAAVSAKTQKSPIEAWQSLPESSQNTNRRTQDGLNGSKQPREGILLERFSQETSDTANAGLVLMSESTRSGKSSLKGHKVAPMNALQEYNGNDMEASTIDRYGGSQKKSRRRSIA